VIDSALAEWNHLLPRLVKSAVDQVKTNNVTNELELPYNPNRFNYLGPIGPACKRPLEIYGSADDEKRACGLKSFMQKKSSFDETHSVPSNCVVFSIGSNNQWGFEEAIFKSTFCRIEVFDCTVKNSSSPPAAIQPRTKLHFICLGEFDEIKNGRRYMTWNSIIALTSLTHPPTFLKMDIEGYEFPVMKSIIDGGKLLPLQIAMEIHYVRYEKGIFTLERRVSSMELFAFMFFYEILVDIIW